MADHAISPEEQILARATKLAIRAAGGLEICERETGTSDSQLSRCCSPNARDSITIRDAAAIEAIGHGQPGHPHIVHALARLLGGVFIQLPDAAIDAGGLQLGVLELSAELGDISGAVRDALGATSAGGSAVTPAEAMMVLDHIADLDRASARLRHSLEAIAKGRAEPP